VQHLLHAQLLSLNLGKRQRPLRHGRLLRHPPATRRPVLCHGLRACHGVRVGAKVLRVRWLVRLAQRPRPYASATCKLQRLRH
jgi:hypothetical protein